MTATPANYYDNLPTSLYGKPLSQTIEKIQKHQNVLVAGMLGVGRETFLKMLLKRLDPKLSIIIWDMQLPQSIKSLPTFQTDCVLVLNKLFLLKKREKLLEQLHTRQIQYPNLTVIGLTDHTAITKPDKYFAQTHQFFQAIYHLTPFDEIGTQTMFKANRDFYDWKIPLKQIREIHDLTGGIARLVKYVCNEINDHQLPTSDYRRLVQNPAILFQLKYLYELLLSEPKDQLKRLCLLDNKGRIRSSLLRYYFHQQITLQRKELKCSLTPQEQTLFNYFVTCKNRPVSVDQIADLLTMSDDSFSLWKIYKLISRLKPKLKPHYDLKTNRGKGYSLTTAK